jgi:nucleoside-diphosphate-sugar epimerase
MLRNSRDPENACGKGQIIGPGDLILITGAAGFIGSRVVAMLLGRGFGNLRCFVRPSGTAGLLERLADARGSSRMQVFTGNLLSGEDCHAAAKDASVIIHLAAGTGQKSYPEAFLNSVVTTRNLLEAALRHKCLKRFVNISSFSVYTNTGKSSGRLLDESCPVETMPALRGEAYCFAKVKQDELLREYHRRFRVPYVTIRPGYVYGPGKRAISGRVGIDTFGLFLHLGGGNKIPLTYVDNCADAIALAAIRDGIADGEVFNVVDDDLPSSRQFLRLYKQRVKPFASLYVPHAVSYVLCWLWEKYSAWSEGQLPPAFNRKRWNADWRSTRYSNAKLKKLLGWTPGVSTAEGLKRYFAACRDYQHA